MKLNEIMKDKVTALVYERDMLNSKIELLYQLINSGDEE